MKLSYPMESPKSHSYAKLIEGFKSPAIEYAPVVMWFWNDDISEEGITFQLQKFKEQKIINFFIHTSIGVYPDYLSDRFMELIKHAVSEAKRLDMKFWIYDELDWPSGVVGGKLLEEYPQYRQKELYCEKMKLSTEFRIGTRSTAFRKGDLICAKYRNPFTGETTDVTDRCEVIKNGEFTTVNYENKSMCTEEIMLFFSEYNDVTVFSALAPVENRGTHGYLDMFNPEACKKYIEMTHEKYKEAVGEEFGKTVPGVFTDEPTTLYKFWDPIAGPWSDTFLDTFKEMNGYDLVPYIQALFFEPINEAETKAKNDYFETMKKLYHKNFCGQISEWCRENGLMFTGHFGGEEELGGHLAQGDMLVELVEYLDIPGIDSIVSSVKINQYNFNTAPKLLEAAAKFGKRDRTLSETYTVSGGDFRFPEMKRVANRLITLGVNMIHYMGASYSNSDGRKALDGTVGGYFNPLFIHYNKLADYISAPSYLSAATTPTNRNLVFIPLKEFGHNTLYHLGRDAKAHDCALQALYEDINNALLYEGIGYDLFSEDYADKVSVKDGVIEAFGYTYDSIVFPSMKHINEKTAKLIKALKDKGAKVVFIECTPSYVLDTAEKVNFGFNFAKKSENIYTDGNAYLIKQRFLPYSLDELRASFKEVLGGVILNIESDKRFYISERENDAAKVYFIINDEKVYGKAYIDAVSGLKLFSADTKEEINYTVKDGRIELDLTPFAFIIGIVDKASSAMPVSNPYTLSEKAVITPADDYAFETPDGNYLPFFPEIYSTEEEMWIKTDGLTYPERMFIDTNMPYKLRTTIPLDFIPEDMCINMETRDIRTLKINGKEVPFSVNTRRWGEHDSKINIKEYLVSGDNLFEFDCETESQNFVSRPPFIFLSGSFDLYDDTLIPVPPSGKIKSGPWHAQGYRYFIGTGVYKLNIDVNTSFKKAELMLKAEDACEVFVNGQYAGVKMWSYESVDVTSLIKSGNNEIEIRVTSPFGNLYSNVSANKLATKLNLLGIMEPVSLKLSE